MSSTHLPLVQDIGIMCKINLLVGFNIMLLLFFCFNQENSGTQLHLMNNPSKSADMHSFEQKTHCLAYNLSIMPFILQISFLPENNYLLKF